MDEANLTMLDVGPGTAERLNIPQNKLDTAIQLLKREGYNLYTGGNLSPIDKTYSSLRGETNEIYCRKGSI